MQFPTAPLIIAVLVSFLLGIGTGTYGRGVLCERDALELKEQQDAAMIKRSQEVVQQQLKDARITSASSDRLDEQTKTDDEQVRYVTKEVVRYVQNPAAKCDSAEWVRIYNASLGTGPAMQAVPEAGPPPAGGAGAVPNGGVGK